MAYINQTSRTVLGISALAVILLLLLKGMYHGGQALGGRLLQGRGVKVAVISTGGTRGRGEEGKGVLRRGQEATQGQAERIRHGGALSGDKEQGKKSPRTSESRDMLPLGVDTQIYAELSARSNQDAVSDKTATSGSASQKAGAWRQKHHGKAREQETDKVDELFHRNASQILAKRLKDREDDRKRKEKEREEILQQGAGNVTHKHGGADKALQNKLNNGTRMKDARLLRLLENQQTGKGNGTEDSEPEKDLTPYRKAITNKADEKMPSNLKADIITKLTETNRTVAHMKTFLRSMNLTEQHKITNRTIKGGKYDSKNMNFTSSIGDNNSTSPARQTEESPSRSKLTRQNYNTNLTMRNKLKFTGTHFNRDAIVQREVGGNTKEKIQPSEKWQEGNNSDTKSNHLLNMPGSAEKSAKRVMFDPFKQKTMGERRREDRGRNQLPVPPRMREEHLPVRPNERSTSDTEQGKIRQNYKATELMQEKERSLPNENKSF